ncbi:MAG: exopolysaccharide biosynthesis polyprenyl glycosylphosphotransferase [Bacteroidota bacterium]
MIVKKQRIVFSYLVLEFILLNFCALLCLYIARPEFFTGTASSAANSAYFSLLIIYNLSWGLTLLYYGPSELYASKNLRMRSKQHIINSITFLGITSVLVILSGVGDESKSLILAPVLSFSVLNFAALSFLYLIFRGKSHGNAFGSRLLVLGYGDKGKEVIDFTENNKHLGYGVVGYLDDQQSPEPGLNWLGKIQDLPQVLDSKSIDEIVITLPAKREDEIKKAIEVADYRGVRVNVIPDVPTYGTTVKSYTFDTLPVYQIRRIPLDNFNNFFLKKAFDMIFSLCVLVFLSPVFLLIGLLVFLETGWPIFYTPLRKGEAGGNFKCYKFRTMKVNDDPNNGTKSTVKNDPRITRIGKYLRKFDLDELPQFLNVLKGDMSVVGPRPHRVNLQHDFRKIVNDYMIRHYVKPGITGWAQVNGWRGPTETSEQKKERVRHDLWYIENWSFWLDIKIVFLTVFSKKTRKNAF